jgi:hypothetical protein
MCTVCGLMPLLSFLISNTATKLTVYFPSSLPIICNEHDLLILLAFPTSKSHVHFPLLMWFQTTVLSLKRYATYCNLQAGR